MKVTHGPSKNAGSSEQNFGSFTQSKFPAITLIRPRQNLLKPPWSKISIKTPSMVTFSSGYAHWTNVAPTATGLLQFSITRRKSMEKLFGIEDYRKPNQSGIMLKELSARNILVRERLEKLWLLTRTFRLPVYAGSQRKRAWNLRIYQRSRSSHS